MEAENIGGKKTVERTFLRRATSTPAAAALLAVVALAAGVGMLLPDDAARAYVFGRAWFWALLGVVGICLVACMVRRAFSGSMATGGLLTHGGIVLILLGAAVTLVSAERGAVLLREGETADHFSPEGGREGERAPLGFSVRLLDFRIERYPSADHLVVRRRGRRDVRLGMEPGGPVRVPGTDVSLKAVEFLSAPGDGMVEVELPDGAKVAVAAEVGKTHDLRPGHGLEILRYEPSFKMDTETKVVGSDAEEPRNPALQVRLVVDGQPGPPRWLFARAPSFRHDRDEKEAGRTVMEMRFLHPAYPVLEAEALTPSGPEKLRIAQGSFVQSPCDPTLLLGYEHDAGRPKQFESEVEIVEEGRVVKRRVVRVNEPLKHRGVSLHQLGYDDEGLRWSVLGVSRDGGAWVVFAGFIVASAGLFGRFYLRPLLERAARARSGEGGAGGAA